MKYPFLIKGALFPWRWAVGSCLIAPIACFFLLLVCPETPVWYMTKGRSEDARQALIRLRGSDNMDIVESEFNRIELCIKIEEKEKEINNSSGKTQSKFKQLTSNFPTDMSFWKPFGFLMVLFALGLEWTGFPAIGFYMVPLLKKSKIPFDPFWASAMLASYR